MERSKLMYFVISFFCVTKLMEQTMEDKLQMFVETNGTLDSASIPKPRYSNGVVTLKSL